MKIKFRAHTGPCGVNEVAGRLKDAGIDAHAGTAHVYGTVEAEDKWQAIQRLDRAAGFHFIYPQDYVSA